VVCFVVVVVVVVVVGDVVNSGSEFCAVVVVGFFPGLIVGHVRDTMFLAGFRVVAMVIILVVRSSK